MLAEAQEFVAEWQEMRPVFQHRLFSQCLRAPLQVLYYLRCTQVAFACITSQVIACQRTLVASAFPTSQIVAW